MAIPKVKATYSLDTETIRVLERVARRWGVSKSEALRRAIRASAAMPAAEDERLLALDQLQATGRLTAAEAGRWAESIRTERRASEKRRGTAKR